MIRVACAAITKGREDGSKEILLFRCAPRSVYAGLWCTPGAKVEPDESDTEVLAREVAEGTGVRIWSVEPTPVYRYTGAVFVPDSIVFCYAAKADALHPRINASGLDDWGWFGAHDLDGLPLAPADSANREALKKLLRRKWQ